MSYIKTEDGHVYDESKTVLSTLLGTRVVQVSDEIEPLLECFILINPSGQQYIVDAYFDEGKWYYQYKYPVEDIFSIELGKQSHLYGAVWQGANLVSVARSTEKGQWELL